jgi:hypothetical protein
MRGGNDETTAGGDERRKGDTVSREMENAELGTSLLRSSALALSVTKKAPNILR